MTVRTLEYLQKQFTVKKIENDEGDTCFFAFILSGNERHRLEFSKIWAPGVDEAYRKGEKLGTWVDSWWENELFPTLQVYR